MQPSEQDLRGHFADLGDEALLHTAETAHELTPLANEVLRAEFAARRLVMPSTRQPTVELPPHNNERIVTIRRFRDVSEAIVARAALESASIPCFLRNENTVRIDWQISNAIGGIRLDVLEPDAEAAEAVLLPVSADAGDVVTPDVVCPACGSHEAHRKHRWGGLALASILALGIPLPRGHKVWTCDVCNARWMDD